MIVFKFRLLKIFLLSAGFVLPGAAARATDPETLSLEKAVQLALENNPALLAAAGRIAAAAGRAVQSGAWNNPELELAAEEWPLRSRGYSESKRTIGLSQTVRFPGKRTLAKQVGGAGVRLSEAERAGFQLELVRDVKIAFARVQMFERQVGLASGLLEVADGSASTAAKRVEAGAAALQEQLRAEVQAGQARVAVGELQRELRAARQTLVTLLGRPDLGDAKLDGALAETTDDALLARAKNGGALPAHPALRAAQAGLERAELENRRARLEAYPDVKVGVAAGEAGETGQSIGQVSLSVPLPLLDRGKGTRQEARAHLSVAKAELQAVQLQLRRELADAASRYQTASEQVANYRERILPKALEALRLVQTGYEEGKFGIADLMDTQRTTAEVQTNYQTKLLEMATARAEIEALLAVSQAKS